ncbi:MAG: Asp-tRNA(Asn)/Glu-tRNA(Gln) amidotransferase subunit GatA [Candidatus Moranbacteria bacterium]|jgi:aspartyl-tRNA(Asn)/glutamyl-tRNA(Gln) amidotransferase subunit A|nr:Asp-tRNA(Asn)/Glu-tRNA(Gln) amidotransferase subunit GatA [Candidatus Moranbacteria bacterium]
MIRELHEQLKNKEISAVSLAEKHLAIIKEKDDEFGAFLTVLPDEALRAARFVDEKIARGEPIGPLEGIPGAVKDNMCMEGTRTTAASKILDSYIAPYDATAVRKLKECGAVILGKTNMDEFAMGSSTESSAYRKTKNPVDPERVPGGSSGGSAVAVAADMAVFALGSDTGGSIRQPASFCGVVGLKPTYGRVSRYGLLAMASSLDQIGPFASSVEDVAIVFSEIYGYDGMDVTTAESEGKRFEDGLTGDIRGLRIGVPKEYFSENLDAKVRTVAEAALERFRELGAEIVDISLPHAKYALPAYYIIMPSEVSSNLARFDGIKYGLSINDQAERVPGSGTLLETYLDSRGYGFGDEVKRRIMLGTYTLSAGYYDAYYKKAQAVRKLIKKDFSDAFKDVDVIFSPTAPEPAFKFGAKTDDPLKMYLSDIYTVTANLAGVPAISFPIGTIEEEGKKLPLGGHLMGEWFDEETLLRAADAYEKSK